MATTSYQVQNTDRNLWELASRLKTSYQTLVNLNPTVQTISKGQFLNVPPKVPKALGPPKPPPMLGPPKPINYGLESLAGMGGTPNPYRSPLSSTSADGMNRYRQMMAGRDRPITPTVSAPYSGNPYISGFGGTNIGIQQRVATNMQALTTATNPSQLPPLIPASDLPMMGVTPSQMLAGGYVLKNGNWVTSGSTVGQQGTGGGGGYIDPKKYYVTWNPNAKNKKNRYRTTLAQINNRRKRAKHGTTQPGIPSVRADSPSTTLDLILGS